VLDQVVDVLCVAPTGREHLHRQKVLRGCGGHAQPWVIEDPRRTGVAARGNVRTGLHVQPPVRRAEFARDLPSLLRTTPCGLKTASMSRVARRAPCPSITASAKGILDHRPVQQRIVAAHATPNSCGATYTPRRRKAAGACTSASTLAARVLKGNHHRRSDLASAHAGAP